MPATQALEVLQHGLIDHLAKGGTRHVAADASEDGAHQHTGQGSNGHANGAGSRADKYPLCVRR